MKIIFSALIYLLLPCFAFADDKSHREIAAQMLDNGPAAMRDGFFTMFDPIIQNMRKHGIPAAAADEMKATVAQWFYEEIRWEELKPKMIDLYVKEFSEQELKELLAFYKTPTGKKALSKLPTIMQQRAAIGQQYAISKKESLKRRIYRVIEKYCPEPEEKK